MPTKVNPLRSGDRIGVFLPSSPVKEPYRTDGLNQLEHLGFVPVEVENPLSRVADSEFLSRTPQQSVADFQGFLLDPDIRALIAGRGGYGANLMLTVLDRLVISEPKMIMGASDVSYLLWYIMDKFDIQVFYGPMVYSTLAEKRFNQENLVRVLSGHCKGMVIDGERLLEGTAKGILTGGCLSNFVSLLATPYLPSIKDRILLLEDIGERPYRLDRMFWQLTQSGIFSQIKGLVLGQFPGCFKNSKEKEDFFNRVCYYLEPYHIPVLSGLPVGHGENIHAVPLGVEVVMDSALAIL